MQLGDPLAWRGMQQQIYGETDGELVSVGQAPSLSDAQQTFTCASMFPGYAVGQEKGVHNFGGKFNSCATSHHRQ